MPFLKVYTKQATDKLLYMSERFSLKLIFFDACFTQNKVDQNILLLISTYFASSFCLCRLLIAYFYLTNHTFDEGSVLCCLCRHLKLLLYILCISNNIIIQLPTCCGVISINLVISKCTYIHGAS